MGETMNADQHEPFTISVGSGESSRSVYSRLRAIAELRRPIEPYVAPVAVTTSALCVTRRLNAGQVAFRASVLAALR